MSTFKELLTPENVVALYKKHKATPATRFIGVRSRNMFCPLGIVAFELLEDKGQFLEQGSKPLWEIVFREFADYEYTSFYRTIDNLGEKPLYFHDENKSESMIALAKEVYAKVDEELGWNT